MFHSVGIRISIVIDKSRKDKEDIKVNDNIEVINKLEYSFKQDVFTFPTWSLFVFFYLQPIFKVLKNCATSWDRIVVNLIVNFDNETKSYEVFDDVWHLVGVTNKRHVCDFAEKGWGKFHQSNQKVLVFFMLVCLVLVENYELHDF